MIWNGKVVGLGIALLGMAVPSEAQAQFEPMCTSVCFEVKDQDTEEVVGHGCGNDAEGGDMSCEAGTDGCTIMECDDGEVVALASDGLPAAVIRLCGASGDAVNRDLIREPLGPMERFALATKESGDG